MKYLHTLLIFLCLLAINRAAPSKIVSTQLLEEDHELIGGFFEGDMEIDLTCNGVISEARRWPNNEAYYKIDPIFDEAHRYYIMYGMAKISAESCIRFYPATADMSEYLYFIGEPTGCHSKVGYQGKLQTLNLQVDPLDTGCFKLGTVQHEVLHALGFRHQQCASNRDDYVEIIEENIKEGKENNFKKYDDSAVTDFDIDYDYGSILHYSSKAFSKNGLKTIVPHPNENIEIGQRRTMSSADIDKLNIMYKCFREI